jgi:hypothetical protein
MNQTNQNNIAPFVEEQIFEEQNQNKVQDILNRFKQPIPQGFVELKVEEGNYLCSTNPKWTNKSLCERYGFYSIEGEWIQIDILHDLMEELELTPKEDIVCPLYLSPTTLEKTPIRGAIEIEDQSEIFLDRPISENNVEKELEKRLKELDILREGKENLEKELNEEREKKEELQNKFDVFDRENKELKIKVSNLQSDLDKEKSWWDKWIADKRMSSHFEGYSGSKDLLKYVCQRLDEQGMSQRGSFFKITFSAVELRYEANTKYMSHEVDSADIVRGKQMIKIIAEWYKNKV